ncbi:MAG: ATP-binding cassette domain-containing protein [Candidatus Heimdallarchaeota archaeon]|nr:ATP-binding cassette domain-containing protein [Candidatus Heimdallarchaeota archaeon]
MLSKSSKETTCGDDQEKGPIICLKDIAVAYQSNVAIFNVDLDVYKNQIFAIFGPNGSGKSTLLKTIVGAVEPFRGVVKVFGKDITRGNAQSVKTRIGYLPQSEQIDRNFPALVKDVVEMGLYPQLGFFKGIGKKEREKVQQALVITDMDKLAERPIGHLSGGQQQKARIARAIVNQPDILLMDEPFSSLDFKMATNISDLILKIHQETDITIVVITHSINFIKEHCTAVACIDRQIIWQGEPQEEIFDEVIQRIFYK